MCALVELGTSMLANGFFYTKHRDTECITVLVKLTLLCLWHIYPENNINNYHTTFKKVVSKSEIHLEVTYISDGRKYLDLQKILHFDLAGGFPIKFWSMRERDLRSRKKTTKSHFVVNFKKNIDFLQKTTSREELVHIVVVVVKNTEILVFLFFPHFLFSLRRKEKPSGTSQVYRSQNIFHQI